MEPPQLEVIMRAFLPCLFVVFSTIVASAQSINIEIAPPGQVPSGHYGAAGSAGVWNSVNTASGVHTNGLLDLDGNVTAAYYYQIGGSQLLSTDDPGTSGNDDAFLDDYLITYTPTLETCHFIYGLDNGTYEVLLYSWMPNRPDVQGYNSSDQEPGYPHKVVGGAWTGQHTEGVTFTRHICYVVNNRIWAHSGIVPGHNSADGAAANGLQIRKLPPQVPGDMNCDGAVNGDDIAGFVKAVANWPEYAVETPSCNVTNADMNGDHFRDVNDISGFVSALLAG
jgi:hypothetical protein